MTDRTPMRAAAATLAAIALLAPAMARAQDTPALAPALDSGDTAWMLTSTALVLMMTIPGLALFYGGMVRKKNVLATVMQSFAIACLVTVLWMVAGYSLAFGDGGGLNAFVGGLGSINDLKAGNAPRAILRGLVAGRARTALIAAGTGFAIPLATFVLVGAGASPPLAA